MHFPQRSSWQRAEYDVRSRLEKQPATIYCIGMELDEIKPIVTAVCRDFDIKRLDAFGSLARGTQTSTSDVDLLVEFRENAPHRAKQFFGLLHRLEDTLGCEVDLLTARGLRNPYFRRRILKERRLLYEG